MTAIVPGEEKRKTQVRTQARQKDTAKLRCLKQQGGGLHRAAGDICRGAKPAARIFGKQQATVALFKNVNYSISHENNTCCSCFNRPPHGLLYRDEASSPPPTRHELKLFYRGAHRFRVTMIHI